MLRKQDYPPILGDGLHSKTLEEIAVLCVDAFPLSASRTRLMVGLRAMVGLLTADGIRGNLWIDGSFVTKKLEPDDVDVVLEISEPTEITPEQKNRLKWFASRQPADVAQKRADYWCDCYVTLSSSHDYWLRQFGRDRIANPKGIIVLHINGGVA